MITTNTHGRRVDTVLRVLGILPVINLLNLAHLRWAARELSPLHPDYPGIVLRINEIERGFS